MYMEPTVQKVRPVGTTNVVILNADIADGIEIADHADLTIDGAEKIAIIPRANKASRSTGAVSIGRWHHGR